MVFCPSEPRCSFTPVSNIHGSTTVGISLVIQHVLSVPLST